jgi:crotonobetainyl-CoA:carnitine CoA-transferase CaiB-like acyl-CoA transferase
VIRATKLDRRGGSALRHRVIELGQVIAGPFCAQMLGDLGAEVIKVEPPGTGDVLRQWGHADVSGDSLCGASRPQQAQRHRRPAHARGPAARPRPRAQADILVENFRPGP